MTNKFTLQTSFAGGYLDPVLQGTGLGSQYKTSCRRLVNFLPDSRGYLFRRPGTKYGGLKFASSKCRLRTLNTTNGIALAIFVDKLLYLYLQNYNIYRTLDSPYGADDLDGLNIAEINNSLYILHSDYRPYILSNTGSVLSGDLEIVGQAKYDAYGVEEATEMTAEDLFVFGTWTLVPVEFTGDVDFVSTNCHPTIQCFRQSRWFLSGSVSKPTTIYASRSPDYSTDVEDVTENTTKQYRFNDFTLKEEYLAKSYQYLKKTTTYESAGSTNIESVEYESDSENVTLDYDSSQDIPDDVTEATTTMYKEDGTVTEDESERVTTVEVTSSTTYQLSTTVLDSHAIELIEADLFGSKVTFLYSHHRLLAGSLRELDMDTGETITPATFDLSTTLTGSTSTVQPCGWRNYIFYATSDRKSIMAAYYDSDAGGYLNTEITATARSLFTSTIKEMAVMEGIVEILWVLLEDGSLLSCTLSSGTLGWAEHVLGGNATIQSMSIYHDSDETDVLYLVTDRGHSDEDGTPILYLEMLEMEDLTHQENYHLLDGYVDMTLPESTTEIDLSNSSYLFMQGDTVQYSANHYASQPAELGEDMRVAVSAPGTKAVTLGFPIQASVELLPQDIQLSNGHVMGLRKAIFSCAVRVYRSGGGEFGYINDEEEQGNINFQRLFKTGAERTEDTPPYFTGIIHLHSPATVSDNAYPYFYVDVPLPLTIQAFETGYQITEV